MRAASLWNYTMKTDTSAAELLPASCRTTCHDQRGVFSAGCICKNPRPQGKLATVLRGCALEIAVDLRTGSRTFGRHVAVELNEENRRQLWIPRGFAHGFIVRSESADFLYKCDAFYSPADEIVLRWNDPELGIDRGCDDPKVSERDQNGLSLAQLAGRLPHYETA
jgi:dTDP-4-dehydrorhamnose 3,5-epimerase